MGKPGFDKRRREFLKLAPAAGLGYLLGATIAKAQSASDRIVLSAYRDMPYDILVALNSNGEAYAVDRKGNLVAGPSTDHASVINNVLQNSLSSRVWKETIVLLGDFTLSKPVKIQSYTRLFINGRLKADPNWTSTTNVGILELGSVGEIVRDVEIEGGIIEANYYSAFPTTSGQNNRISGIYSLATLINVVIKNIRFNNIYDPIFFEKLGGEQTNPSKNITIKNIIIKDCLVGPQFYANGYEYYKLIIENVLAENVWDDVIAVVGHYGGVPDGTATAKDVLVRNIIAHKNGGAGAVVKLDAGDTATGVGALEGIIIDGVVAYTGGSNEAVVAIFKGGNSFDIQVSHIKSRGTFKYGIWNQGAYKGILISDFDIVAEIGILLQSSRPPSSAMSIKIGRGDLRPPSAGIGKGIELTAGSSSQGWRNITIENVKIDDSYQYGIYEGATPSTGVQGIYQYNRYLGIDIGGLTWSALVITSNPVELDIYRAGAPLTKNSGTATFSGDGVTTQFIIAHGLPSTPSKVRVIPASVDAAGDYYITKDVTYIYVNYKTAPPSGTDNIILYWEAET